MSDVRYPKWDYKEYPKSLPPDDLWGQVRRTVYGKAVSDTQIRMIIDAIVLGLSPSQSDYILDIGCGNGALASELFDSCDWWLGVDSSEYLISIARERFAAPTRTFHCCDAVAYSRSEVEPNRFNKALCYGVFAYFSDSDANSLLELLHTRFVNLNRIFIGGLPDPDRAAHFFKETEIASTVLDNPQSQIGVWRSHGHMEELARATGWDIRFQAMPEAFYQAHYRYNAILDRRADR